MKVNLTYLPVFFLLFTVGCSSYESTFQSTPLIIDGSSSDWETTLDFKKSCDINYGVSNDTSNLYLRLHIIDQEMQMKILIAGLTIWIDTLGKTKETYGISCPLKKAPPKMDRNRINYIRQKPKWNNTQFLEAEFIGFEEHSQIYYISDSPWGIEISLNQDEFKSMYYELKIPYTAIGLKSKNYSARALSIGIETGSIEMPKPQNIQSSARPGSGMGGRPGGIIGTPGGGMGGKTGSINRQRANIDTMNKLSSPTRFWIKNIGLAVKKLK